MIAFSGGEPMPEFLPGVRWAAPADELLVVARAWRRPRPAHFTDPAHPLFQQLALRDCTWHYHGVLHTAATAPRCC